MSIHMSLSLYIYTYNNISLSLSIHIYIYICMCLQAADHLGPALVGHVLVPHVHGAHAAGGVLYC